jgi:hypothetical protein
MAKNSCLFSMETAAQQMEADISGEDLSCSYQIAEGSCLQIHISDLPTRVCDTWLGWLTPFDQLRP